MRRLVKTVLMILVLAVLVTACKDVIDETIYDKDVISGNRPFKATCVMNPPFPDDNTAPAGYQYDIVITGIDAMYATSYEAFIIDKDEFPILFDEEEPGWNVDIDWIEQKEASINSITGDINAEFDNLEIGNTYTVCVAGRNKYGLGTPLCQDVTIPDASTPKIPEIGAEGISDDFENISISEGSILITSITSEDADIITAQWKRQSEVADAAVAWQSAEGDANSINIEIPVEVQENVLIRLRGSNAYGEGAYKEIIVQPYQVLISGDRPDPPGCDARVIDQYEIYLENISGSRLTNFELYYCEGVVDTTSIIADAEADATGASWVDDVSGSGWTHTSLDADTDTYPITGLDPGTTYTFLLSARNEYGLSVPTPIQATTEALPPELAGTPEIGEDGTEDDDDYIDVNSDSIIITNLWAENIETSDGHYFIAYWKDASNPSIDVDGGLWQSVQNNGDLVIPVGDDEWTIFTIRIYSNNLIARSVGYKELTVYPPTVLMETNACNVYYGYGAFRSNPYNLIDIGGQLLDYTSDLSALFDSGITGAFDDDTCMRIVVNGQNVVSDLGLTPVNSLLDNVVSASKNEIIIDPVKGEFLLPRPIYYSKCENIANMTTSPEITLDGCTGTYSLLRASTPYVVAGKFGNALQSYTTDGSSNGYTLYDIFGSNPDAQFSQYTISLWFMAAGDRGSLRVDFGEAFSGSILGICLHTHFASTIYISSALDSSYSSISRNVYHHLYVLIDQSQEELSGGESVIVFLDGQKILSTTSAINIGNAPLFIDQIEGSDDNRSYLTLDNIKIWNEIVTENPAWEYNNGNGREEAMHVIYGSGYNYYPNLTGGSNGVGYYMMD